MDQKDAQSVTMADVLQLPRRGVLELDAARSSGDLGVRHALWGSQRIVLVPLDGEISATAGGGIELLLSVRTAHAALRVMRAPAGAGTGAAQVRFAGARNERVDANLYEIAGDLTMSGVTAPALLRVRDLGWTAFRGASRRHTLAISATLPREVWAWAVTRRQTGWLLEHEAKLFLHSEWVPEPEAAPAA